MMVEGLQPIAATRVVAVVRGLPPDAVLPLARALADGGIRAIEVTLDSPGSLESIRTLRRLAGPGLLVAAGTVLDSGTAQKALRAGAQALITPGIAADVAAVAREERVPVIMGAITPSEVLAAHRAGATMVKLFPAALHGPEYVRYLRRPLAHIPLLCTGGVTPENAADYLAAGAAAVGVGRALVNPEAVAQGDWGNITRRARALIEVAAG